MFLPLGLEIEDNVDLIMAFQMNIRAFAKWAPAHGVKCEKPEVPGGPLFPPLL